MMFSYNLLLGFGILYSLVDGAPYNNASIAATPSTSCTDQITLTVTASQNVYGDHPTPLFQSYMLVPTHPATTKTTACSLISKQSSRIAKASPTAQVWLDMNDALDCLYSIPLDKEITLEFLTGLTRYLEFQSTLSYLKDPPYGSDQIPVDILSTVQDIYDAVKSEKITGEYELEYRLTELIGAAHDGHLALEFFVINSIFFVTDIALLSLSTDGIALPSVFVAADVELAFSDSTFTPSAVEKVNGVDVSTYLEDFMFLDNSQGPDARYNHAFASINPPNNGGGFYAPTLFTGNNTFELTFANGTSKLFTRKAVLSSSVDLTGIDSGYAWYTALALATGVDTAVGTATDSISTSVTSQDFHTTTALTTAQTTSIDTYSIVSPTSIAISTSSSVSYENINSLPVYSVPTTLYSPSTNTYTATGTLGPVYVAPAGLETSTVEYVVQESPTGAPSSTIYNIYITNGQFATDTAYIYKRATKTSSEIASETPQETFTPKLVFYDQPFVDTPEAKPYIQDLNAIVAGFFHKDPPDTAVLDINAFEAQNTSAQYQSEAFQLTVQLFLEQCRNRGTKHLIIDTRGNGGGLIEIGYDLYKQLFPSSIPYSGTRLRASAGAYAVAKQFSKVTNETLEPVTQDALNVSATFTNEDQALLTIAASNYDFNIVLDTNNHHFETFEDFWGPETIHGDNFTNVIRVDVGNPFSWGDVPNSYAVSGYGARANFSKLEAPFKPEDIILLSDGTCASTCTIFSEFMQKEQNVRSVFVGGRPQLRQAAPIGGTRGSQVAPFSSLLNLATILQNGKDQFKPSTEDLASWKSVLPGPLALNIIAAQVNFKDNIRENDPKQQPLQFYQEPADCRLFFTYETFSSSIKLWGQVLGYAWGEHAGENCAVGSLASPKTVSVTVGRTAKSNLGEKHATSSKVTKPMSAWILEIWNP